MAPAVLSSFYSDGQFRFGLVESAASDVNSCRKLRKIISTGDACLTGEYSDVMCPVRRIPRDFGANYRMFNVCSSFSGLLLGLLVLAVAYLDYVNAHTHQLGASDVDNFYGHPLKEFSSHTIIKPQIHHGKHKRAITNTLEEEGLHASHITLSFEHDGRKVLADLQLNEQLIPQGHFLRYRNSNGENVVQNLTKTDVDLCHYQGTIRGNLDSRVAVSTCNGINGVIFDGTDTYYIYSGTDGQLHDDHYLFRHADRIQNATCGFDSHREGTHSTQVSHKDTKFNRFFRYKRSTADNIIRGPYNANKHSSFVELVIVVDNKVYKSFGENIKKVHNHCKDIANIVNALYVPLNIFIALVGVVVWTESNEIEFSSNGDTTLKNFLHYRRKELVKNHPNDNAQLLTKETFEGGVVGKALKGPICTFEYSGGVSVEHSPVVAVVATTVAHEMGHNFGMEHDEPECDCVDKKCIMSASSTSYPPSHWSSCSIDQLNVAFSRGMNYCLRNKPTKLFDSPQCGNGFVEVGEQCDCGLPDYCENTCCDPNTCMLHANASCATGECCDLTTCRPKAAGTECRSAEGECDLPEYCTGESEYCPTDVFKRDTEVCDGGQAFCYQGGCRSRSSQCKILWGPSGNSSDHCYEKNTDGTRHGNCGFDRLTNQYMQCKLQDVQCGMLHCRHVNERLEFGMESVAVLSHSFMNHLGSIIPCRTAIVDLGLESTDPGLTPNGARCGTDKMCVDQKCVSIEHLRMQGVGVECPENCNGNGFCNSKGHCHCAVGFAPPFCSSPGSGGSEDSGPATNPNSRIGFTRAMYIFFLGVVPVVSLFLFFTYYWKHNRPIGTRKAASVSKTPIKSSQSRGPASPSSGGLPTSTPSSTDDMNSALLKSPTDDTAIINNTMFGKFKGFTLRPLPAAGPTNLGAPNVAFVHPVAKSTEDSLQANGVPLRLAPPVPKPPIIHDNHQTDVKMIKQNGTLPHGKKQPPTYLGDINHSAPALPPPNPGFNGRPIISSPVLEASTCTAKELISPLKTTSVGLVPVRAAPAAPAVLSPAADPKPQLPILSDKKGKDGTIKRIASFLKKEEKVDNNSQKYPPKLKPVLDREKLKNIEISAPIPVVDQSDSENIDDNRQQVARTQSMRDQTPSKKPNIMSFGSMRQAGAVRPKSIVGSRPKSPPPRPPAPPIVVNNLKTPGLSDYQYPKESKPVVSQNEYDDCEAIEAPLAHISEENSPTNSDNIYSVIDERPSAVLKPPPPLNLISGSNDSMGLLGEIVNEIEKRNVDSIYSASTLKKKKSPESTADAGDYSEGDYVKSNGSTTSSGYLRPSALNTPVARVAPTRPDLPPSTTAAPTPVSSSSSSTTSNLSSFKPKTSAPLSVSKQDQKPTSIIAKAPSSPSSTRRMVANKVKAPPSLNSTTKTTSDSVRKRSPSPAGPGVKSTTGLNRSKPFAAKTSPGIARKNSVGDPSPKGAANADTGKKSTITSAGIQKPKPLSKPAVINKSSSSTVTNNSTSAESRFGRQNSAGDTSKSTVGNNAAFKRTKSTDATTVTNPKSSTNNSLSNNSNSSISSNKVLNSAAARPALGKISNVASLQQKFENAASNKATANSNSSTGNSLSNVKK